MIRKMTTAELLVELFQRRLWAPPAKKPTFALKKRRHIKKMEKLPSLADVVNSKVK